MVGTSGMGQGTRNVNQFLILSFHYLCEKPNHAPLHYIIISLNSYHFKEKPIPQSACDKVLCMSAGLLCVIPANI